MNRATGLTLAALIAALGTTAGLHWPVPQWLWFTIIYILAAVIAATVLLATRRSPIRPSRAGLAYRHNLRATGYTPREIAAARLGHPEGCAFRDHGTTCTCD